MLEFTDKIKIFRDTHNNVLFSVEDSDLAEELEDLLAKQCNYVFQHRQQLDKIGSRSIYYWKLSDEQDFLRLKSALESIGREKLDSPTFGNGFYADEDDWPPIEADEKLAESNTYKFGSGLLGFGLLLSYGFGAYCYFWLAVDSEFGLTSAIDKWQIWSIISGLVVGYLFSLWSRDKVFVEAEPFPLIFACLFIVVSNYTLSPDSDWSFQGAATGLANIFIANIMGHLISILILAILGAIVWIIGWLFEFF